VDKTSQVKWPDGRYVVDAEFFHLDGHPPVGVVPFLKVRCGMFHHTDLRYYWELKGTLAQLAKEYLAGRCMLGIVLDCMEECPEAVDCDWRSLPVIPLISEWFRREYPVNHLHTSNTLKH
jgi:hypothetical protein